MQSETVNREERIVAIRDHFKQLRAKGWYPLHEAMPAPPEGRQWTSHAARHFQIAQARYTRPNTTYTELGEEFDISGGRVGQIIAKLVRRWRHPGHYGTYVQMLEGRRGKYRVGLADMDESEIDGRWRHIEVEYTTTRALLLGVNAYLASFDACLMAPLSLELTEEEIAAERAAAEAKRKRSHRLQLIKKGREADARAHELLTTQTPVQRARFYALNLTIGHRIRVIQETVAIHQETMVEDILEALPLWNAAAKPRGLPWIKLSKCNNRPWYDVCCGDRQLSYHGNHMRLRDAMVALGVHYRCRQLNIEDYLEPSLVLE